MKISLVNHASLFYEDDSLALLTDPWYSGRVFGDSWELMAETPEEIRDRVTVSASHIYISHEHPDHFHPSTIRSLFRQRPKSPEFLIPKTADGRMRDWFAENSLKVRELSPRDQVILGSWKMRIVPHGTYDSYMILRSDNNVVVHLGDSKPQPREIAKLLDPGDRVVAIATQFSIASWPGNRHDSADAAKGGKDVMSYLQRLISEVRPYFLLPFASHVYFCHPENLWMNNFGLKLSEIADLETPRTQVQVLTPGNSFEVLSDCGEDRDTARREASLHYWSEMESRRRHRNELIQTQSTQVSLETIRMEFEQFVIRTKKRNNQLLLRMYRQATCGKTVAFVFVSDLDKQLSLDFASGILTESESPLAKSLSMSSDALCRALADPHGADEFMVAGRFEGCRQEALLFHSLLAIATLNRAGIQLRYREFFRLSYFRDILRVLAGYRNWRNAAAE